MTMIQTFSQLLVKHFLSLPRVGRPGCITLLKKTFKQRLGPCLMGDSVSSVLSCNLSSTAHTLNVLLTEKNAKYDINCDRVT